MFNLETLVDVVALIAASKRERAILWQDAAGNWRPFSTGEVMARVYAIAQAFAPGESSRVTASRCWPKIAGSGRWWTSPPWCLGAADVPIYPTLTAEQIAGLLIDSGARIAVVSTEAQYNKVASVRSQTQLERIVVMDEIAARESTPLSSLLKDADAAAATVDMERWLRSFLVKPQDLATLIYTSGTTGEPKGVMLTHGNIASNLNYSTRAFSWGPNSSCVSFLPLSHITARHLDYALFCYGATIAYCGNFERLPGALTTIQPTVFVAVPRVYEKIRDEVQRRAGSKPMLKKLFAWALATGHRHREEILRANDPRRRAGAWPIDWSSRRSSTLLAARSAIISPEERRSA